MPDASAYPLMRPKRRLRLRVDARYLRLGAVLAVALLLLGGAVWASRPGPPDPLRALAHAQATLDAGNYSAARSNALIAVGVTPRSAEAQAMLARAYLELGEGLPAEAALGRARVAGMPAGNLRHLLAHARLLQGDAGGALIEANRADPRHAGDATRVRAEALAVQGQGAVAKDLLEQALEANPRDGRAWTALGRMRLNAGEMGGAADAAATAVRLLPGEPAALTLQGEVVRARFGLVAALPWFEAALARDAFYSPALIQYAATLGDAGRSTDALAATRKALRARPGDPPALYLQAVIAARAGKVELAQRLLAATGGRIDGVPGAVLLDGALDAAAGRQEEAAVRLGRLVAAQPLNLTARRLLAAAQLHAGDAKASLEVLRPMALRGDADAYTLGLAARSWELAGQRRPAAALLDRAGAGGRAGAALFATDEGVGALAAQARGAAGDPTYALGVIRGLMATGDRAGALGKARALAAAMPRDPAALLAWGDTLAAVGRYPDAAKAYARAADLQFDEPTAMRLVDAWSRAGRPVDAAATLALYLRQNPQSLSGRRLLGHWQAASGDWDAAIETLEGVRGQVGDRDAGLLADLALAYAGGGDGAIGRRYGRAAYALAPMNAVVADAYGVALAADGEIAGARQMLDKALALAPGMPAYLMHRRRLG